MHIPEPEPLQIATAAALVAAFAWPGVRAVARWDRSARRYSWPGRVALGFLASFGTFSALCGPLLLAHHPTTTALWSTAWVWALAVLGVEAWCRLGAPPAPLPAGPPAAVTLPPAPWSGIAAGLALASLGSAWAIADELLPRGVAAAGCAAVFAANLFVLWRARPIARPIRPEGARALRWLHGGAAAAAAAIALAAAVATTMCVPDAPHEGHSLSQALALTDSAAMGSEHALHRGEALPPSALHAWSALELWGALVARVSGVHALALFRTLLAPLCFVLTVFACYELFRRILPPGSVAVCMLVTLAYSTFGVASQLTASTILLPRAGQGRTWLLHLAVPALVRIGYEFMRAPRAGTWALVLLVCFASLGFAPASLLLVPSTLAAVLLAYVAFWPSRESLLRSAVAATALAPLVGFALWMGDGGGALPAAKAPGTWQEDFFFAHLDLAHGAGALELFPLVALPLAALFLEKREQLFYPVAFTVALFASATNPLFYPLLSGSLARWEGYDRLFWLVPYALLMGVLAAGLIQIAATSRWPRLAGALVLAGFLLSMPATGGRLVFGDARAENAFKMPADLLRLAETLADGAHGPSDRILCSERSAAHLAPLVPAFDFVFVHEDHTSHALRSLGRHQDAGERERLARAFLAGAVGAEEALPLLAAQRVRHVVLDAPVPAAEASLAAAGFVRAPESFGTYELWSR